MAEEKERDKSEAGAQRKKGKTNTDWPGGLGERQEQDELETHLFCPQVSKKAPATFPKYVLEPWGSETAGSHLS